MQANKTAIILGSTGLTGSILLKKLVNDERYRKIKVFTRNHVSIHHPKIEEYLIDLFELEHLGALFTADEVYCCVGTTKSKTPDKDLYRDIDFGIPATAARLCKINDIHTFLVISSLGADEHSNFFYNRIKGEMEGAVLEQRIPFTYILQPSLIGGKRKESRTFEQLGKQVMKILNPVLRGKLKKYRSIDPEKIAATMVYLANNEYPCGRIESDQIQYIAEKCI